MAFFNHAIVKGNKGYTLTVEISEPVEIAGNHPFTFVFVRSKDLSVWEVLDFNKTAFPVDRYCGGATMKYINGYYYIAYMVEMPGCVYVTYISRSKDLETWEFGKYNPFLSVTSEDIKVADNAAEITEEMKKIIPDGCYCSASDADFCEFNGKTIIDYVIGNQIGLAFMVKAELENGKQFVKDGKLEGLILHTNAVGNLGFEAYERCAEWMKKNGDTEL